MRSRMDKGFRRGREGKSLDPIVPHYNRNVKVVAHVFVQLLLLFQERLERMPGWIRSRRGRFGFVIITVL